MSALVRLCSLPARPSPGTECEETWPRHVQSVQNLANYITEEILRSRSTELLRDSEAHSPEVESLLKERIAQGIQQSVHASFIRHRGQRALFLLEIGGDRSESLAKGITSFLNDEQSFPAHLRKMILQSFSRTRSFAVQFEGVVWRVYERLSEAAKCSRPVSIHEF